MLSAARLQKSEKREHHQPPSPPQQQRTHLFSRFIAKNAAGRSLESILQAVKHDYCFEPFTAEDKPQNKNEIKAQLLRFTVKFYHQIHTQRARHREKRGLIRAESLLTRQSRFFPPSRAVCAAFLQIPALLFPSLYLFFEPGRIKRKRMLCRWISLADIRFPKLSGGVQPRRTDGWKESCWILEKKKSLTAPEWNLFFYARPPGCVQFYRAHRKKGMAGGRFARSLAHIHTHRP